MLHPEHHQLTQASIHCGMQRRQTPATKRPRYRQPMIQPSVPSLTAVNDQSELFTQFIDFVKTTYKSFKIERDPKVLKWPPTPSKVFINLACIDRKRVSGKSKKYKEVTEAMIRDGNVDVIHGGKFPIDMDQIASGLLPNPLETVILVEGAPGVGKSTFAWEYCRRWGEGEIAQQYQLVLLIRLRDDRNSKAKTLKDLIHHRSESVTEAVNNVLEATAGTNTLIILEGFDELPDTCRSVNSVFMQLICGEILPYATIMVTSRPWATRSVRYSCHHRIFQHIEIMGFTSQQITSYIKSALPASKVSDLEAYLERHPQIRAGMYIPLNSAIVVTVYQESLDSECDMPTTLTELYTDLVKTLLVRYLHGHPGYETKYIQSFTDLPSEVYAKFLMLCQVAYDGIVNTSDQVQLIFSERDLPRDFDNLGFMDSVTELYVTKGTISSHNFLHLTFQEFFAAFHISTMSPEQQLKHFNDHNMQSDRMGGDRMNVVLRFVAGLTKLKCLSKESVNHFLHKNSSTNVNIYRKSCDARVDINLLNWMFETQSNDVIELLLEHKIIEIHCNYDIIMLPMDCYCLGYCIAHSQCQWMLRLDNEMNKEMLSMLVAGVINTSPECTGTVVGLRGDILTTVDCLNMLFSGLKTKLRLLSMYLQGPCDSITWPDLSELRVLELLIADIEPTNRRLDTLLSKLSLESLTIRGRDGRGILHYEDCVAITHHLKTTSTLKHINISEMKFSNVSGLLLLFKALQDHPTLQQKNIENLHIIIDGDDEAKDWAQLYEEYSHEVSESDDTMKATGISDDGAVALAQALHHNSTIQELDLSNNSISDAGAVALAQALHHNSTMKELYLSNNSISDAGAVALAQALHHNSTMKELYLSNNSISDDGAVALSQALHHNSTMKELDLSNNSISDAGAVALAQALHHNSTMKELYLSNNSISDAGAVALAQALHHNSTMKELNLSNNSISDDGAVALAQALHHNSTLKCLRLRNAIGEEGTRALIEALTVNTSITTDSNFAFFGLVLPTSCEQYATQCPQYDKVKNRIIFSSDDAMS